MPTLGDYLIIGVVAAVVTFVVTPAVGWFAKRRGWVYIPNERSVHTSPVPDVGGLAMLIGFFAALGVARMLGQFDGLFRTNTEPLGVAIAAIIIFLVGFIDDIYDIPPPAKVTGTVLAGIALVWFGVTMYFVPGAVLRSDRPVARLEAAGHRAVAAGDDAGDQSHRRPRRSRRRDRRHRRRRVLPLQQPARRAQPAVGAEHRSAVRDHHRRAVPRLPPAQLQPGADLHGRLRRLPPRAC